MDPKELDEQFQAMESDSQVQAAEAGTPPAPPVRRRITTAQVKKELDELKSDIEKDVLDWLGNLDTRMESLEATTAKHNATLLSDVKVRLDVLESVGLENLPSFISDTTERFQKLENATSALADITRSIIDDVERLQPAKAEEIVFAKPPVAIPVAGAETADIEAVASVCLTMNDVLLVCRALKDSPDILNTDKISILGTACRAAGIDPTHGLMIRAGVKYQEA